MGAAVNPGETGASRQEDRGWPALPGAARLFVAAVIAAGAALLVLLFPLSYPRPAMFAALLIAGCLTSLWKVTLPVAAAGHATLSMSYAANVMALLLLGPQHAIVVAVAGVWAQSTLRTRGRYPRYRTAFNMGAEAITMAATGAAYVWLGAPPRPFDLSIIARPLIGAIVTYFVANTGLVATAIALSTRQHPWKVWRDDFLWSGASFMVAGTAGAVAAVVVDRGEHWAAVLFTAPVYLTYRTYLLFVARLEDQKRHEQALSEQKERAEQANRLKDQFLAMVSHELRTPLNAILGWADMLRTGNLDAARHDRASQAIYDNARRQAQLIDELLDGARIVSGTLHVARAPVDLNSIVRSARDVVQPVADAKGVHVVLEGDGLPAVVDGDEARLQQVAWNLLSNAVKFTPAGGTIRARVRSVRGAAELSVIDTGTGIPPDFLPAVFEPFRQADGSATRAHGGLGLGLTIVRHLVEAHGGNVSAASGGAGMGATFTVRLPAAPGARSRLAPASAILPPATCTETRPLLEGLSVLVVDDDDETRQVIAAHLESHRAIVFTAKSAAQAFEMLQRQPPDVLLADVAMPGEDGYSLIRRLRAMNTPGAATIPAVAVTAFARDEDRRQALQAGFQLHLAKPIEPSSLVAAVAKIGKLTPA
jgi:signal transduction histidine kinase/ActR/RegA family two-component response regulator